MAAAAVLVLVGGVGLLVPRLSDSSTAPVETTPTAALVDGWAITDIPNLETVIGTTDEGFVAMSTNFGDLINVVYTSEDGLKWERSGSLGEGAWAFDIERQEGTLVAVGAVIYEDEGGGRAHSPAIWTSTDRGATWTRTDLGVTDITTTPDGFVAVGVERRDDSDPTTTRLRACCGPAPTGCPGRR
jgi:hypothetical protein